jgi:hypothetical protein
MKIKVKIQNLYSPIVCIIFFCCSMFAGCALHNSGIQYRRMDIHCIDSISVFSSYDGCRSDFLYSIDYKSLGNDTILVESLLNSNRTIKTTNDPQIDSTYYGLDRHCIIFYSKNKEFHILPYNMCIKSNPIIGEQYIWRFGRLFDILVYSNRVEYNSKQHSNRYIRIANLINERRLKNQADDTSKIKINDGVVWPYIK